jgi:hypothetical protein
MKIRTAAKLHVLQGALCASLASMAGADPGPLELLVGRWEARVQTHQPEAATVTYVETYRSVLGGGFIEGRTEQKSDGTEDRVFATHDAQSDSYLFWVFSSAGKFVNLPPAKWDARARSLDWTNPWNSDISYSTRVVFTENNAREWTVLVKDWKGTVLLRQSGRAVRRAQ